MSAAMSDKKNLLSQLAIDRDAPTPRRIPWLMIAIAVGVLALLWVMNTLYRQSSDLQVVETAIVRSRGGAANNSLLDASGYVVARRQATVSAKVTGKVESVLIEEGMKVEAGQLLATLEPVEAEKQLALSRAQAAATRAQIEDVRVQLADALRNQKRQRELLAKKLVSQSTVDIADTSVNSLQARLQSALRQADVSQSSVAVSQQSLDNTRVYAPFAGVVIAKAAQVGEIISPLSAGGGFTRTGIGTIVDMDSLEVEVDVNESFLGKVKAQAPTEITLNAYPDWKIKGTVIAIIPTADRSKATVKVRVGFGEKDERVLPDMGARVSFLSDVSAPVQPQSLSVPLTALFAVQADRASVYVLEQGSLRKVQVEFQADGADATIRSGLSAGQTVALKPQSTWAEGMRVKVQ
jgi:RND family efflux transporter MFP subunit